MIRAIICLLLLLNGLSAETTHALINQFSVSPKSPAVLLSPYTANTPALAGEAIKISTLPEENYPIVIFKPISLNIAASDTFSFYAKTDTYTKLEVAFEDHNGMTEFENINEYLPEKGMRKFWQNTKIPLTNKHLQLQTLKNVYFKIITNKNNKKDNIYLFSPKFENFKNPTANDSFKINDFENGIKNRFNAEPKATCTYPSSINYTFDSEGKKIDITFTSKAKSPEIFIPILKNGKPFNAQEYTKISFLLRTGKNIPLKIKVIYQTEHTLNQNMIPHYTQSFALKPLANIWQNITIPLSQERVALTGILISFYPYTSGKLSLDTIRLD